MNYKLESRQAGKHQQPQIRRWYHSNGRKQRRTKEPLIRVKEESERASLKLNIKKTKIIASRPIISWQIEGEKVEAVTDFFFLGLKITADDDYSHEISRWSLLSRKAMTNLRQCVEKQRHYSADKGPYSQGYGLPSGHVRLWELDCKEGRGRRIDAFKLWCWRRPLKALRQPGNQISQS